MPYLFACQIFFLCLHLNAGLLFACMLLSFACFVLIETLRFDSEYDLDYDFDFSLRTNS